MEFEAIIGLEIHIQAKTKSKMFSAVSADYFGKPANTNVDPVTLGLPGALPVPNKKAIEHAIRLAMALNCRINKETKFDRKNYFYPDLPKAYQISQYDQPIGEKGFVEFTIGSGNRTRKHKINITRLHLEEDTGKSIHEGNETLLDFNKAGVPLIEVVTEPEFRSGEEIDAFAKRMRQIVRYLGVSDADMEKGQMRYELNISLRKVGEKSLPNYKVEVKNIGSISLLQRVLEFEIGRQAKILKTGERPVQETRGTRDMTGATYSQRVKEEAADYRYFPEPDIPPLNFSDEFLAELRETLPALPEERIAKFGKVYDLGYDLADTLVSVKAKGDFFQKLVEAISSQNKQKKEIAQEIAKLIVGEIALYKKSSKKKWQDLMEVDAGAVTELVELKLLGKINSNTLKDLVIKLLKGEVVLEAGKVESYLEKANLISTSDSGSLEKIAREVIAQDPTAKDRFAKNPKMAMFFVGQVMKETKGTANPQVAKEIVERILSE